MDILLVAATAMETTAIRSHLGLGLSAVGEVQSFDYQGIKGGLLHSGIGMVNTGIWLGRCLDRHRPQEIVQFGIGGAFEGGPMLEEVVEVIQDCYAELGADSPEGFLPLEKMGFPSFELDGKPHYNVLEQPRQPLGTLRTCRAVTVNRVSGVADRIAELQQIWSPEVESMEGAAFFQVCLMSGVPFRAFRAISNRVEPRNRANWHLREAVEAAQTFVMGYLNSLSHKKEENP